MKTPDPSTSSGLPRGLKGALEANLLISRNKWWPYQPIYSTIRRNLAPSTWVETTCNELNYIANYPNNPSKTPFNQTTKKTQKANIKSQRTLT